MKQTETCPKCRSMKLFVVDEVRRRDGTAAGDGVVPVTVTAARVGIRGVGLFGDVEQGKNVEAGRYQAWICAGCGYTERYATRLEELAVLADAASGVRVIERKPEGGPFRS